MRSDELDPDLLDRYLAGECSVSEEAGLRAAAERVFGHPRALDAIRAAWAEDAAWLQLRDRLDLPAPPAVSGRSRPLRSSRPARWRGPGWQIAAAAIIACLAGIGGTIGVLHEQAAPAPTPAMVTRDFSAAPGAMTTVRLADGTQILLGASSTLHVGADYGRPARRVTLVGEAYFDVRHDAAHPFSVETGRGVAEDLGTQFVVRSYPSDTSLRVVVVKGRVALRLRGGSSTPWILPARSVGEAFTEPAGLTLREQVDVAPYLDWTEGRLEYANAPLRAVIGDLERWYAVRIRIDSASLADRRITATFQHESLSDVLDAITGVIGARWARAGDLITLTRRRRRP